MTLLQRSSIPMRSSVGRYLGTWYLVCIYDDDHPFYMVSEEWRDISLPQFFNRCFFSEDIFVESPFLAP